MQHAFYTIFRICKYYFNIQYPSVSISGLRHLCQELINCEDGMICAIENATKPAAFGAKVQPASQYKVCLCDEADGWVEDLRGTHCSGAFNVAAGFAPLFFGLFVGMLLAQKQMH